MSELAISGAIRRGARRPPVVSLNTSGGLLQPGSGVADPIESIRTALAAGREPPPLSFTLSVCSDHITRGSSIRLFADGPLAERAALPPGSGFRRAF